jgi:uncharacterized protein (TIGR02217 family)
MLHGFRWRDRLDHSSAVPGVAVTAFDQTIGTGDGVQTAFPLVKIYGGAFSPYARPIAKPVSGSVRVAVDGVELEDGFTCDIATGIVTFADPPGAGDAVTAGFLFDVPVRFDTDYLEVDLSAFAAGAIPKIPLVEIRV